MYVHVTVELRINPNSIHQYGMQTAARSVTDDRDSVQIIIPEHQEKVIIAMFTIKKARQMDVVDKIGRAFRYMDDYEGSIIGFPKKVPHWYKPSEATLKRIKQFTPKQGQYLAFIYYYTKINGRSPAERDIQNYFQVTPPTVHKTILELARRGLISRVPRQPRSIKLLLSHEEFPDLA